MLRKVTVRFPEIISLLSLATSEEKTEKALISYLNDEGRQLFVYCNEGVPVGCIGIFQIDKSRLEVTHIAVAEQYRNEGVGSKMIDFVFSYFDFTELTAETDSEAVGFYQNYGFEIQSLGEKYPNVERFYCVKKS